jgi:plasmid stabilization system protein ParE
MVHEVVVSATAERELEAACAWLADRSPEAARRWRIGLLSAIESLATFPDRCGIAPESSAFERDIRCLTYGKGSGCYRVLFTVSDGCVIVLHVRHGARDRLGADEVS